MSETCQVQPHISQEHPFYAGMTPGSLTFVAHRGGDGAYENTLGAFAAAEKAGITTIETDVIDTADGVAVHFHGDSRTRKEIRKIPYDQLNTRAAHERIGFNGDESDYIPALAETLHTFPELRFFLDLKSRGVTRPVIQAIKDAQAQHRVSVDGHRWTRAVAVIKELPEVSTTMGPIGLMALHMAARRLPGHEHLRARYLQRAHSLSLPLNRVEHPLLDIAHDLGLPAFLYRVHDERDIDKAARLGARGIMADRLSLLGYSAITGRQRLQPQEAA